MTKFDYKNIEKAYSLINSKVLKTPLVTNDYINKLTESNVYFKLENLQITGSFKFRGALNKIIGLSDSHKKNGVIAYSSGNHAQAVAYVSNIFNVNCRGDLVKLSPLITMPL